MGEHIQAELKLLMYNNAHYQITMTIHIVLKKSLKPVFSFRKCELGKINNMKCKWWNQMKIAATARDDGLTEPAAKVRTVLSAQFSTGLNIKRAL